MINETVYPIVIQMNSKDIQIGHARVGFENEMPFARFKSKWNVILKETKIGFKKDEKIGEIVGGWN